VWDIDRRMIALARGFFGKPGVGHTAACGDALCESPGGTWDVVLLLKLLPCLERQERGAGARLIGALRAAHVVVSYPAASLGGRSKGMPATYAAQARELADATGRTLQEVPCGVERVFVLGQAGSGPSG